MELYTAKQKEPQGKEGHSLDGAVSESVPLLICVSSYQIWILTVLFCLGQ